MTLTIGGGRLVTPGGVRQETLTVDGARIVGIAPPGAAPDIDARGGWIVPGFIDLQINGAHGIDVTTQPERIGALAAVLPRYGVTAFLPTVITCPSAQRAAALAWFADRPTTAGAVPLGLHLEGPLLAAAKKGAHREGPMHAPTAGLAALVDEEVDLPTGRVAEGGSDRSDRRRELGRRQRLGDPGHRPVFYLWP